jgi:hypothetical protein
MMRTLRDLLVIVKLAAGIWAERLAGHPTSPRRRPVAL